MTLEKYMAEEHRSKIVYILESALKYAIHAKDQKTLDLIKDAFENPGELLNTKITEIESFEIKENGDKLSITFKLVQ